MHGLEELPPAAEPPADATAGVSGETEADGPHTLPQLPSHLASLVDSFAVDVARNYEVRPNK
jgi:hypothetical protein